MVRVKLSQETPFTNILIVVVVVVEFFFDDQAPFFHAGGAMQSLKCFSNTHVIVMPNDLMLCGLLCRIDMPNNAMFWDGSCWFWCWLMLKLFNKMMGTGIKEFSISKLFSSFVIVLK